MCDDGGESATCNDDCTVAMCGDGMINASAGEICDDSGESATCDSDCTPAECGDGVANMSRGRVVRRRRRVDGVQRRLHPGFVRRRRDQQRGR